MSVYLFGSLNTAGLQFPAAPGHLATVHLFLCILVDRFYLSSLAAGLIGTPAAWRTRGTREHDLYPKSLPVSCFTNDTSKTSRIVNGDILRPYGHTGDIYSKALEAPYNNTNFI